MSLVSRPGLTLRRLESLRDRTFRRLPACRIRGAKSALQFLNEVGFSLTLSDFGLPVPSLRVAAEGRRNPRWPRRTHHDPAIILAWNLKDELPAKRLCYYGRVVRGKPTLVSLEQFGNLFALVRGDKGSGDYLVDYRNGELSRAAFRVLERCTSTERSIRRTCGGGPASAGPRPPGCSNGPWPRCSGGCGW